MVNGQVACGKAIKILGAGVSGLTAAIILSKYNYNVEIYEKRPHVGSFFEKDIHSFRNYLYKYDIIDKYNELGIEVPNVYPVYKEFRFSPSMKKIEIYSKGKPLFYNFFRGCDKKESFDVNLFKTAKENGVKFFFNQKVTNDNVDVVASGASSAKMIGYGAYYSGVYNINPHTNYIFLDDRYSPRGYSYILPFNNEAVVVIGSTKAENKEAFKKRFYCLVNNNQVIKNIIKNSKLENEIFGYSFYDFPQTAIKNNKLYTGEAAGLVDAATGFGTHYAILSGYFAAMAIVGNKNYDILWKQAFGEELKNQYLVREKKQKYANRDYENIIDNLIKKYGDKISSSEYRVQHKSLRS